MNYYYAVPAAAAASLILSAVWYSPFLLGKHWQKAAGVSPGRTKWMTRLLMFLGSFVLLNLMALGMALLLKEGATVLEGLEAVLSQSLKKRKF